MHGLLRALAMLPVLVPLCAFAANEKVRVELMKASAPSSSDLGPNNHAAPTTARRRRLHAARSKEAAATSSAPRLQAGAYAFIDSKKSALLLVLRNLSSRKSMASIVPIGFKMRRRMYIFLS